MIQTYANTCLLELKACFPNPHRIVSLLPLFALLVMVSSVRAESDRSTSGEPVSLDRWVAHVQDKETSPTMVDAYYGAGSPAFVGNAAEGSTDIKLEWESENTELGFIFKGPVEKDTAYTATVKMGQFGGKKYSAQPIELLIKSRKRDQAWKTVSSLLVSDMLVHAGRPGPYSTYQLSFNTRDFPDLIGGEEIRVDVNEQSGWTQGYIGDLSLEAQALPEDPPNIVFIFVDDLGWADVGSFGSTFYETPNIDRLAAEGMRFTDAYAAGAVCSPSRVGLMTGKYPPRMQSTEFFGCPTPERWSKQHQTKLLPAPIKEHIELAETTLGEAMQAGGYKTFYAGKWHGGEEPYWPQYQGFGINKGGWTRGGPYGGDKYFSPYGNPMLEDGPKGEHLPDRLANETVQFMEANQEQPFFAFLSFYSVHTPLISRPDLERKYEDKRDRLGLETQWRQLDSAWDIDVAHERLTQDHATYAGMVEGMDLAVGKVLAALDDLGIADNTIVIFTSDNGGLSTTGAKWVPTSSMPLRAGKGWLYEGGIRVPTLVRWPGVVEPGSESAEPIIGIDFYPTLLEAAGLPMRPEQHLDGISILPLLTGGALDRDAIYWHYPHYGNQGGFPGAIIRQGDWKLIEKFEGGLELYNLSDDLGEQHNLADTSPKRAHEMLGKLKEWQNDVEAIYPSRNPNRKGP